MTDLPKVLDVPSMVDLPLGERGTIRCQVRANPPVIHVDWEKDGAPLRVRKRRDSFVGKKRIERLWGKKKDGASVKRNKRM